MRPDVASAGSRLSCSAIARYCKRARLGDQLPVGGRRRVSQNIRRVDLRGGDTERRTADQGTFVHAVRAFCHLPQIAGEECGTVRRVRAKWRDVIAIGAFEAVGQLSPSWRV